MIRSLLRVKWLTKNILQCSNVSRTHSYKFICRSLHITHRNLQQLDYYTVLGLNKNASQNEIKSAYYQLSKKYHPDVAGSDAAAAKKFLEINEAYECLKDPEKRRSYDNGNFGSNNQFNGNYSDPFYQFYQQTYRKTYQGNPFHNRQFTQAEYERIWNEFNRLRNTREFHERQNEFLRNKIWMDYAKRRAERWQSFHERYPNGAPGSVKWEFRFGRNDGGEKRYFTGRELLRTLFMTYFVCFMIVSFFQLLYQAFNLRPQTERGIKYEEPLNKDKIEAMMSRRPESPTSYMYSPPGRRPQIVEDTEISPVPSEALVCNIGKEVTFSDGIGPELSTYVPSK